MADPVLWALGGIAVALNVYGIYQYQQSMRELEERTEKEQSQKSLQNYLPYQYGQKQYLENIKEQAQMQAAPQNPPQTLGDFASISKPEKPDSTLVESIDQLIIKSKQQKQEQQSQNASEQAFESSSSSKQFFEENELEETLQQAESLGDEEPLFPQKREQEKNQKTIQSQSRDEFEEAFKIASAWKKQSESPKDLQEESATGKKSLSSFKQKTAAKSSSAIGAIEYAKKMALEEEIMRLQRENAELAKKLEKSNYSPTRTQASKKKTSAQKKSLKAA